MLNDYGQNGPGFPNPHDDSQAAANRRTDQRHLSVFRVGKLISAAGQELCLIRNISSGGLMAHIYGAHEQGDTVAIEFKANRTVSGKVVWARDRKIGVQFDEKVDVADVLAPPAGEAASEVIRAPRLDIHCRGRLRVGAQYQLIELFDISQGGAKIGPAGDANMGDEVVLMLDGLPPLTSIVRWCRDGRLGLIFKTSLPFDQLASWIPTRRRSVA